MSKLSWVLSLLVLLGLLVQSCNPEASYPSPLEGVVVEDQIFEDDETTRTIEVNTRLDNIAAVTTDLATNKPADWLSVKLGKSTIAFKLLENISIQNRKAEVRLYHDAERTDMTNTELSVKFLVEQKRNKMFDSLNVEEVKMSHLPSDTTVSAGNVLKNVKIAVLNKDGKEINWCTVKVIENELFIKVAENRDNAVRQAFVRLYLTPQSLVADSLVAKRMILVTQDRNPVLDSLNIEEQTLPYEDIRKVINTNRPLTNIKPLIIDDETKAKSTWLTAIVAGDSITLHATKLKTNKDRSALVTLYLPKNGETIDETTIAYSFRVKQEYNHSLENAHFPNRVMRYDQTTDTFKVGYNLDGFKAKLVDTSTDATPKWLSAAVSEHSVVFKASTLTSRNDRSAVVTLYQPTNGDVIDSTTIAYSFTLTQLHNNATDSLTIPDQTVEYDQTLHAVTVNCSLKGFKAKLVDLDTELTPKWLTVEVNEHQLWFSLPVYDGLTDRKARVTIYQPNGNTIDENTIQHQFVLTQRAQRHLTPDKKTIEVDYTNHQVKTRITSNVKYQIERGADWIIGCTMTPIDDVHEELTIEVAENKTNSKRTGQLTLRSGDLTASITISQQTNPAIVLMDGNDADLVFGKTGGEFFLNVSTLTPDYKVQKNHNWFSVGAKEQLSSSSYRHRVTIPAYTSGPLRTDTIVVKNFAEEKTVRVVQHNYLYFEKNSMEIEEGSQVKLKMTNHTSLPVTWKSKNPKAATVDNDGLLTAIASGKSEVTISIGSYFGLSDYYDMCKVTVFNAADKLSMSRAEGKYVRNGDYVTANCDLILKNDYRLTVTIKEVRLLGNSGAFNVLLYQNSIGRDIASGMATTISVNEFTNVYKPSVAIKMSCGEKEYDITLTY